MHDSTLAAQIINMSILELAWIYAKCFAGLCIVAAPISVVVYYVVKVCKVDKQ